MADNEHSTAALGDSEVACVEHPPGEAVPEVGQRSQYDAEVPTIVRTEESGYVLDEQPGGSKSISDPGELVEQAGALACEAGASSGDGYVLTREPASEDVCSRCIRTNSSYVHKAGRVGPVGGEDAAFPRVGFALEGDAESGAFEAEVESADAGEEAPDEHSSSSLMRCRPVARAAAAGCGRC
jgi:hypothetical protein